MDTRYSYHLSAAINVTLIRPFTKDDFYLALEQIKQSSFFQNLRVVPDYAHEGGFMISGHERSDDVFGHDYKTVRFTRNQSWSHVNQDRNNVDNWKDSTDVILKRVDLIGDPTSRRNQRRGWQDFTFVCKATTDVPRWTKEELMVFANALISTGAFKPQSRKALVSIR